LLGQEQMTAAPKEKVLDPLGKAASKLRGELGESLATVQKCDVPLVPATTPSREALKAYAVGAARKRQSSAAALPYFLALSNLIRILTGDTLAVADQYNNLGQPGRANEYVTKAFRLREHIESARITGISEMI
jgi:eukaryotic-like serine/threonine-protein kinase